MGFLKAIFKSRQKTEPTNPPPPATEQDSHQLEAMMEKEQQIRRFIADKVYKSTNKVADGMNEVAKNIDELGEKQKNSFADINKIKDDINSADQYIKKSGTLVTALESSTKDLSTLKPQFEDQATHLRELEQKIGNISEIDTHVKLLSFNASLEASRAGDAGRSFMVVADEIQKLSGVTNQHLGEMSNALQLYIEKNNIMSGSVSSFVDNESDIVQEFSGIIAGLLKNVDIMTQDLAKLSSNVEAQLDSIARMRTSTAQKVEALNLEMSQLIDSVLETEIVDLSPKNVYENIDLYQIIDVRRDDEYGGELGHIENSKLITISPNFADDLHGLDRTQTYLFVCRSGGRSARAARIAQISGFKNVFNMEGGMLAWNDQSLPTQIVKSA